MYAFGVARWVLKGFIRSFHLFMTPGPAFPATRLLHALALCVALLAAGEVAAAPLKVVGRFLQDTHGNNILMRGVNVPVYKSGWADDLDAVAAAIALTKTNVVRL
jgi:hypothetical protein